MTSIINLEFTSLEQAESALVKEKSESFQGMPLDGIQEAYTKQRLGAMHNFLSMSGKERFPVRITMVASEVKALRKKLMEILPETSDIELSIAIKRFFIRSDDQLKWLEKF